MSASLIAYLYNSRLKATLNYYQKEFCIDTEMAVLTSEYR